MVTITRCLLPVAACDSCGTATHIERREVAREEPTYEKTYVKLFDIAFQQDETAPRAALRLCPACLKALCAASLNHSTHRSMEDQAS